MKRTLFFFLLLSNFALAQNKIQLTLPGTPGSGSGGFGEVSNDFRLSNDSLYLYRWANIMDFGAVADGVTNNVTAINSAIASGAKVIYIPPVTLPFLVTGTAGATPLLELQDYQCLVGSGYYSQLKTTSGARIIRAGIGSEITGVRFTGDNSQTTTEEFQAGIYAGSGDIKINIHDCWFENLGGNSTANGGGVVFSNTAGSATEGSRIVNNHFINNHYGITFASRGEYNIILGNKVITSRVGIYNEAGNNSFISNTVQDCDTAFKLYGGTNDGHCVSSGNTYNHNDYNLIVDAVANGYTFHGDMYYAGNVDIRNSTGIRFTGVDFSSGTITLTNNTSLYRSGRWLSMTKSVVSGEDFNVMGEEKTGTTATTWIRQTNSDTIEFKGPMYHTGLTSDVGNKSVRYNTTTKRFTYADTTTGGGSQNLNTTLTNGDDISSSYTTSTGANTWTISTANSGTNPFAVTSTTGNALALNATTGNALNAVATGSNAVSSITKHTTSTNDISDGLNLLRTTTGTAAVGLGNRISLWGQTSTGAMAVQGYMETAWTNATNGAQASTLYLKGAKAAAVTDYLTIDGTDVDFEGQSLTNYISKYNNQTNTTYTLLASDAGKIVTFDNAADITLTVPTGLPVGFTCTIIQLGAGEVIFTASSTTINNRGGFDRTNGPYAMATITQMATSTFITGGDMQ